MSTELKIYSLPDPPEPFTNEEAAAALAQGSVTQPIIVDNSVIKSAAFKSGLSGWSLNPDGSIEAQNALIRGNITATTGAIGGWVISDNALTSVLGDYTTILSSGVTSLTAGLTASPSVLITRAGALTAKLGTIANWSISENALSTGDFNTLDKMYFGSSGLSLSNKFVVTPAGALTATSGAIGGFTLGATAMYGGIIKTAETVEAGSTGVIMDTAGLRGYDSVLGKVFDLPTDGSAPSFASGSITETAFEINTNAVLRTSATVGDGSVNSAGILINNSGLYGCEANQTLANANVKILATGSAVFVANIRGGQTDFATGTGYFLGLSGGDYKFSIGSSTNYLRWDGTYLKIKGSFDVGSSGIINNALYTVANLPIAPTAIGFENASGYE